MLDRLRCGTDPCQGEYHRPCREKLHGCTSCATCNRGAKLSAEVDPIGELRIATAIGPPSLSLGHFIDGTRPPLLLNTTAASGGRVTLPSESSTMRCPREGSLRRTGGIDLGPPFHRRALQGRIDERQRYIWT